MRVPVTAFRWLGVAALLVLAGCQTTDVTHSTGLRGGNLPPCTSSYDSVGWSNCYGTARFNKEGKYITFTGEWQNGLPNGKGTLSDPKGGKYTGELKNGIPHGLGTVIEYDGSKYVGDIREAKRHGWGTLTYADGVVKEGVWRNGKLIDSTKSEQQITTAHRRPSRIQTHDNKYICEMAIQSARSQPNWEHRFSFRSYIDEAKRRGFTEQQCARLSGWFTEQQIAAVHARPSELVTSSDNSVVNNLAANSSERVCTLALKLRRPIWDDSVDYRLYVSEAKRRGLTEQQCAPLSGRFTEQQIAAAHVQPKPSITDKVQVAEVQRLLIDLGHLTGRADGVVGPRTEAAVKTFERARQLPPTGTVDDKLIVKLKEAQQAKLARAKSDEAKTLAQLREESRKVREETRKGEARITGLKKQAEQLATLRAQKPTKQPVRTDINFGNYHALVIGINRYHNLPRLRTAVADAEAIADVLKSKYGFSVSTLINPTRTQILDRLDNLRAKLNRTDNLLIYYAGHGWLDNKADQGFWLPVDARKNFRSEWVANSSITGTLKAIKAKHVMVVADSCYSGRLIRGVQMAELNDRSSAYLKQMARKKTRVVITSGGLEPVEDGRGEHSPFARAFLNALNRNDAIMDGTNLFNAIREPVMLEARQTPEFSNMRFAGHDGGDFLFVRRK